MRRPLAVGVLSLLVMSRNLGIVGPAGDLVGFVSFVIGLFPAILVVGLDLMKDKLANKPRRR